MAKNLKLANAAANAAVEAIAELLNGGTLEIYSGTQPANADAGVGAGTLLAVVTFANPAFETPPVAGVATAEAIVADASANNTGTAAWFRAKSSAPATVFDGSVGVTDADLTLPTVSIVAAAEVAIDDMTITLPKTA